MVVISAYNQSLFILLLRWEIHKGCNFVRAFPVQPQKVSSDYGDNLPSTPATPSSLVRFLSNFH